MTIAAVFNNSNSTNNHQFSPLNIYQNLNNILRIFEL